MARKASRDNSPSVSYSTHRTQAGLGLSQNDRSRRQPGTEVPVWPLSLISLTQLGIKGADVGLEVVWETSLDVRGFPRLLKPLLSLLAISVTRLRRDVPDQTHSWPL